MDAWVWIVVAIVALIVIGAIAWIASQRRRSTALREQFGPEYDRTLAEYDDRREGEGELAGRRARVEQLDIRPLDPASRRRYVEQWQALQSGFVDDPAVAVTEADGIIVQVMRERGYPIDDFEQRAADVSVDHPTVVENYRAGHAISKRATRNEASTEELRRAVIHYRALFEELVNEPNEAEELRRSG
jgi:hypothetical protein